MAIDTVAKRASALAALNQPYLRLVIPSGAVDRPAALGMYNGLTTSEPEPDTGRAMITDIQTDMTSDLIKNIVR